MHSTFICLHCGKSVPHDPRIKKHKYCSSKNCQNARKRLFELKTCPTPKGKSLKNGRNKRWRDARPAHEYQKQYRESHPDYVKRNREMQVKRNKKCQKAPSSIIVKTDTLMLQLQAVHRGGG